MSLSKSGGKKSVPKTIPQKTIKSYCNSVSSLDNKFCNQYTIREFLESPKDTQDSPIQIINHRQLATEKNPPPDSFTPPQNTNLLHTVLSYLRNKDNLNSIDYNSVSTEETFIDNSFTQSPYRSMIFNLDN